MQLRACQPQIDLFVRVFPKGQAEVTEENIAKALYNYLDVPWLIWALHDSPVQWYTVNRVFKETGYDITRSYKSNDLSAEQAKIVIKAINPSRWYIIKAHFWNFFTDVFGG
jgi:hypothetical protein